MILEIVDFPVNKDPNQVCLWLDKQLTILVACGGSIEDIFLRQVVENGLGFSSNPQLMWEIFGLIFVDTSPI